MSKSKKQYICSDCGSVTQKWQGKCFDCGAWSSIIEEVVENPKKTSKVLAIPTLDSLALINTDTASTGSKPLEIDSITMESRRIETGIAELDRILGGGLVESSVILIGGDPGIGKSTLLLRLSANLPDRGLPCVYITGEESVGQIKLRAKRLGAINHNTSLLASNDLEEILAVLEEHIEGRAAVIIDSIQTLSSASISGTSGTVSQIRYCTQALVSYCKSRNIILLIACHVTKDGQLAGPKVLEHTVDTVLYFEGDGDQHFRILRSIKNRFGSVNEIGVFEMLENGLREVPNPSDFFLTDRKLYTSGSSIFAAMEGSRSLLIEIQALVAPSNMPSPRRSAVGWELNRLSAMLAVLQVRFGVNLSAYEVYLSVVGGIKISEPAADLAVIAALISAVTDSPISPDTVFFGEVGLAGEIRKVTKSVSRIKEAVKMGFLKIICAEDSHDKEVHRISHVKQLKSLLELSNSKASSHKPYGGSSDNLLRKSKS